MTDLSRNPFARDFRLFGGFEQAGSLNHWVDIDAWELEDAVALTLGKNPLDLSETIIREKCPEDIVNRKLLRRRPEALSPLTQLYMERYERLKRAAIGGSLQSIERGGKIWFKPHDFLTWYDTKSGWKDNFLPVAMKAILEAWRANAQTAFNVAAANEPLRAGAVVEIEANGKPGRSSLGVPQGKKGLEACKDYLRWEMKKSRDDASLNGQDEYRPHCKKKFGISGRAFDRAWTEAAKETECPWAKRGRPRKAV